MIENQIKTLNINATHIIFISDIHFGVRRNSEEWQENLKNYFYNFFIPKIREIKSTLSKDEKLICINLGDTYDDRKSIDIDVSNLSIDIFEDISKEIEVYVLNGNHDLSKRTNQGNTSLRSIEYIPNIFLITEPTLLDIVSGSKHTKMIAIPYLGNNELETQYLAQYSAQTEYALMHTEISKMKMDNGMLITKGTDSDIFKGMILSGHIHRRQESKKVIYIGSPYHTSKGDIGDVKGIYTLNLLTKKLEFTRNDYSPIYHTLLMDKYAEMSIEERKKFMDNNYNFIIINEEDLPKYKKKFDIYNLGIGTLSKMAKPVINQKKQEIDILNKEEYTEMSISELINESISQLDLELEAKERLYLMSDEYLKNAEAELSHD